MRTARRAFFLVCCLTLVVVRVKSAESVSRKAEGTKPYVGRFVTGPSDVPEAVAKQLATVGEVIAESSALTIGLNFSTVQPADDVLTGKTSPEKLEITPKDGPSEIALKLFLKELRASVTVCDDSLITCLGTGGIGKVVLQARRVTVYSTASSRTLSEADILNKEKPLTTIRFYVDFKPVRYGLISYSNDPEWLKWDDFETPSYKFVEKMAPLVGPSVKLMFRGRIPHNRFFEITITPDYDANGRPLSPPRFSFDVNKSNWGLSKVSCEDLVARNRISNLPPDSKEELLEKHLRENVAKIPGDLIKLPEQPKNVVKETPPAVYPGRWVAAISRQGSRSLQATIEKDDSGIWNGHLLDTEKKLVGIPLTDLRRDGSKISFAAPSLNARFDGKFEGPPDGPMVGTWVENGAKAELNWLPQTKSIDLRGFKFATDEFRNKTYHTTSGELRRGVWTGVLPRGGKNSPILLHIEPKSFPNFGGSIEDMNAKIRGIPIENGKFNDKQLTFEVPVWNATCTLTRDPAYVFTGFWECHGRKDSITLEMVDDNSYSSTTLGPMVRVEDKRLFYNQVTADALEYANSDKPAADYDEAIRTANPYYLCDICTKGFRKPTSHRSTKPRCHGEYLNGNALSREQAIRPQGKRSTVTQNGDNSSPTNQLTMTGRFFHGGKGLPATLYLRMNGESVSGEEVFLNPSGSQVTLTISGTIKDNELSAEIRNGNQPWSTWRGNFNSDKSVLKGRYFPGSKDAYQGSGQFTFNKY